MKTDALIAALAADDRRAMAVGQRLMWSALLGAFVCGSLLAATLGVRGDIVAALGSWRFCFKIAVLGMALALAIVCSRRAAGPLTQTWGSLMWLLPALLAGAVMLELMTVPQTLWKARLVGTNSWTCLTTIPLFALMPLALTFLAVRNGAPRSPALAGGFAGLAAAALGAITYGLHCFDDSPLFVAVWYPLAALPIVALGALLGHRFARW